MDSSNINKQPPNPRFGANIISKLLFWWLHPILTLGYKRDLKIDDIYRPLPDDSSETLRLKLQREWDIELEKASKGKKTSKEKPNLHIALWKTFGSEFLFFGVFVFIVECGLKIAQPLCLGTLIHYFEAESTIPPWQAYVLATGVVLSSALYTFIIHPFYFGLQHIGMKIRIAACSLIYGKSLILSQKALGQTTTGQMVNLLSNDVNRFDSCLVFLHYTWVGPIQVAISMAIIYQLIGASCLPGLFTLILFVPLQGWLGKIFSGLRMSTAIHTDERIRTMNEILSGMRVIKMYTWEKPFAKLIKYCRKKEIDVIRRTNYFRSLNMSLYYISSKIIVFLTFLVYVVAGNSLSSEKVFVTMSLFNNIRLVMTLLFPNAVAAAAETFVSIKRIENFLMLDEIADSSKNKIRPQPDQCGVDSTDVTVKWPSADEQEDDTLKNISFKVKPRQVLAVVGHVGSGKSSLLNIIMGELSPLKGSMSVRGKIAYASQEAWVFTGTVRQNILCGLEYDLKRYKRVVKACALEKDFTLLPDGDRTAVGEKGVSLSGGQKARLNLARALYIDADIYLLDDPLSAVDTHVGRHLFDRAINRFLHDKIRILVTHQLQYLQEVDQIIVLKGGHLDAIGTYYELQSSGMDLKKIVTEDDAEQEQDQQRRSFYESECETSFSRSSFSSSLRKRRESITSKHSINEIMEDTKSAFADEGRFTGAITFDNYWQYFRAGAGCLSCMLFVFTFLVAQLLYIGSDYWLTLWTNAEESRYLGSIGSAKMNLTNLNTTQSRSIDTNSTYEATTRLDWIQNIDTATGVYVYSILIGSFFIFTMIRTVHFFLICMSSSIKLHNDMFESIIRAKLVFFDQNPVGRILNRFSKDIGCMDEFLPSTFFDVIAIAATNIGIIILVGLVNPWLILPLFFVTILTCKFRNFFLATGRNVKRLEATTRSPVFTHLSSTLNGLATLRVHQSQAVFQKRFDDLQDFHSSAWFLYLSTTRWFGLWLDWVCVFYVTCVTYVCVMLRDGINGSEAGLAISSAMMLANSFQWGVRQSTEVENQMVSVERVIEYSKLQPEAALESPPEKKPPSSWPPNGEIQFDCMSLCYTKQDDPVLKNITCSIKAKEKIGIVGRTGAGKSSLISALFRLTEPEGRVIIDGIDSKSIGLHELRSKISIIPQDPVLFSGTMRKNLDPFSDYPEEKLWAVLEAVNLKNTVSELTGGLDSVMTEGGANFSVGQRQLVCMARAILKRNRILVLDEATANVDQKTDALIQMTIREKFKNCTVLTIAHRLDTIMDSDRIMLLDAGHLTEFDEPALLLENPKSLFYGLVEQTGSVEAAYLTELAKQAYVQRRS